LLSHSRKKGPEFWQYDWRVFFGLSSVAALPAAPLSSAIVWLVGFLLVLTAISSLHIVWEEKKAKNQSFAGSLIQFVPVAVSLGASYFWFNTQPEIWEAHSRWLILFLGIGFAEMNMLLILRHLCGNEPIPVIMRPQYPLLLAAANAATEYLPVTALPYWPQLGLTGGHVGGGQSLVSDYIMMCIFVLLTFLSIWHYISGVISELCAALKIDCLTIPRAKWFKAAP